MSLENQVRVENATHQNNTALLAMKREWLDTQGAGEHMDTTAKGGKGGIIGHGLT